MRIWFDGVTRRDARTLAQWWNANTTGRYEARLSPNCRETSKRRQRRLWQVVRVG